MCAEPLLVSVLAPSTTLAAPWQQEQEEVGTAYPQCEALHAREHPGEDMMPIQHLLSAKKVIALGAVRVHKQLRTLLALVAVSSANEEL